MTSANHVPDLELKQYEDVGQGSREHAEEGGFVQGEEGGGAKGVSEALFE